VKERRFQRRVNGEQRCWLSPVAPLGLKALANGVENAALKGRLHPEEMFEEMTNKKTWDSRPRLSVERKLDWVPAATKICAATLRRKPMRLSTSFVGL